MCGICGQFNFKNNGPVILETIKTMANSIKHRGPDDEGYYLSGSLGFGFRRLSIIDLKGGYQPMSDMEKIVWVVFNGEIYNFPELKRELEGFGHVFRTRSDTEVIVHGYKQWGGGVLEHLNGMFGLAIWDERKRQLIIARDRMGIKFIYYKLKPDGLIFASEIRPLLLADDIKPDIDFEAVNLFLRYRFTPSPITIYKGIKKLASGTMLIANENGNIKIKRWYNYKPVPFANHISVKEAEERLFDLYKKAVKRQLISDVPIGLLLSGGVDSALLLALMNMNGSSWKTYSIGYGKQFKNDELQDASRTSQILDAQNLSIEINRETFEKHLSKIISIIEEPIAPSSIVPMYFVCEFARRDLKVAFIGQGPDELFGGYTRHLGVRYGDYWRNLPKWIRQLSKPILGVLPRMETIKRGLYSLDVKERMKRYQNVFSLMPGESIEKLFKHGVLPQNSGDKILDCWKDLEPLLEETDELGGLNFIEIRSTLPDELLLYADKLSMAHGLELRVPYLDHEIVEFVERLPASFKVRNGFRKYLHKRVSKRLLPPEIIQRKKRGFAVNVVDDWFRTSLSGKVEVMLLDKSSLIYEFLYFDGVSKLIMRHQKGLQDNHKILFSLIVLEEVLRNYRSLQMTC